jgi:hypothetical protein
MVGSGQYREAVQEFTMWYDFNYMPAGNIVNGKLQFVIDFETRGGLNEANPLVYQISKFEIPICQVKNNNTTINLVPNISAIYPSSPFCTYTGPTNYYESNAGCWVTTVHNDGCPGGAQGRTSPNWWRDCINPADPAASFIEGDRSGLLYTNKMVVTTGNFDISNVTKLNITFRITQRMNSEAYAPTTRLATNNNTLSPQFVNVTQQNQLNVPNINPVAYAGSKSKSDGAIEIIDLVVKQGCVTLPINSKVNLAIYDTSNNIGNFWWINSSTINPTNPNINLGSTTGPWVVCSTVPDWFA